MVGLGDRLEAVAAFVVGDSLLDVGTDHGRLPAALLRRGRVRAAIASDLREQPLDGARRRLAGIEGAETRCGDGLSVLRAGERVSTVVMAGMGGPTIARLLDEGVAYLRLIDRIVLQPNTHWEDLRERVAARGATFVDESLVRCSGRDFLTLAVDPIGREGRRVADREDVVLGPWLRRTRGAAFDAWLSHRLGWLRGLPRDHHERARQLDVVERAALADRPTSAPAG